MLKIDFLAAGSHVYKLQTLSYALVFLVTCSAVSAAEKVVEKPVAKPVQPSILEPGTKPAPPSILQPGTKPAAAATVNPVVKPTSEAQSPVAKPTAAAINPVVKPVDKSIKHRTFVTTLDNRKVAIDVRHLRRLMKIKSKGISIYYPTAVPGRFLLRNIKTPKLNTHPEYELQFRDKKRFSLSVATTSSGTKNVPHGFKSISGYSKEFGAFRIYVFKPNSEGNKTTSVFYSSEWLKPKNSLSKPNSRYYRFSGTGVNDSEAIAIVKSLTPIK